MKKIENKILIVFPLLVFFAGFFAHSAYAADVIFDPQDTTIGLMSPFKVGIMIDSSKPINAIFITANIPNEFEIVDISDGDSVINFWIERPYINDNHQLVFSGIVPGGFSGIHARLLVLTLKVAKEGRYSIDLDRSSRAYLNTVINSEEYISANKIDLNVVRGRDNILNTIPDSDPPEHFIPIITQLSFASSSPLRWYAVFQSQDKISGINHYEVAEASKKINITNTSLVGSLNWHKAINPYLLRDQKLTSFVYVKAIDDEHNERIEFVEPQNRLVWYERGNGYIILVLIVIGYIVIRKKFVHTKK